jgi:hypothetical protein
MASMLDVDPVVKDYRAFFSLFDWSVVDRWLAGRSNFYGSHGHPLTAYIKAFLIRIKEGFIYTTQLRDFLVKHPLLVIELGFDPKLDPNADYGFNVESTLPGRSWLGEKLCQLDNALLQDLLAATVTALKEEIPGLGEVVAFDVKHIYAWVKENNERTYGHPIVTTKPANLLVIQIVLLGLNEEPTWKSLTGQARRKSNRFGAMALVLPLLPRSIMAMSCSQNIPCLSMKMTLPIFTP